MKRVFESKSPGFTPPLKCKGFTISEMLVVIAVVGVLLGLTVPSWRGQIIAKQVDTASQRLLHHLSLARMESIRSGWSVMACPGSADTGCEVNGSWADGWLGFVDRDQDRTYDPDERILFASPRTSGVDIHWRSPNWIRFKPQGEAWPNGHFRFCGQSEKHVRTVIVYLTGRVRLADSAPSGKQVSC
ncbi:MAG TPA: hypothetical protein DG761_04305 [Gammaproteobacteria bacterium]|jgi:type IV fimbrial biogenesis protein FimT|nr:hypothetical protein [Acidiferrobacteraceae bacterium]MDP6552329.1 GspH/FimT family pseudopilin [Arenicellales bacterium]MDP6790384.1 GspH/FimT family pseudopilin [Arenicellales bacterium]MDP6919595.1 GspH/FimT family pseudopilin [Arenicellales bacterium]HCX87223.1 hypothetical protein [Gammaproteobacteria bacterium]|tara:strand:- start:482 stop:1042 length:561 start_codon:yes stop_codon:yes gene_type:complete